MKTIYKCEFCGQEFENKPLCIDHESSHLKGIDKIKYNIKYKQNKDICSFCDKSYYVYGCEQDCSEKNCSWTNNYKDFIPVEPLHDKSESGGI